MFVVCVIQHMHVVSELSTFFDGDGGGVGGGEWQWYMYVCVIRYMHAVSKFSVLFGGGGVGGGIQPVCVPSINSQWSALDQVREIWS